MTVGGGTQRAPDTTTLLLGGLLVVVLVQGLFDPLRLEERWPWADRPLSLANEHVRVKDVGGTQYEDSILAAASLNGLDLAGKRFNDSTFRNASMRGADLSRAHLAGADLQGADLRGANLTEADLAGADLRGACLLGASFHNTAMAGAMVDGAAFTPQQFDSTKPRPLAGVSFSGSACPEPTDEPVDLSSLFDPRPRPSSWVRGRVAPGGARALSDRRCSRRRRPWLRRWQATAWPATGSTPTH